MVLVWSKLCDFIIFHLLLNHGSWGVFNIREKGLHISEIGYIYVLNLVLHSTLYLVYGKTLRTKYV